MKTKKYPRFFVEKEKNNVWSAMGGYLKVYPKNVFWVYKNKEETVDKDNIFYGNESDIEKLRFLREISAEELVLYINL